MVERTNWFFAELVSAFRQNKRDDLAGGTEVTGGWIQVTVVSNEKHQTVERRKEEEVVEGSVGADVWQNNTGKTRRDGLIDSGPTCSVVSGTD